MEDKVTWRIARMDLRRIRINGAGRRNPTWIKEEKILLKRS